MSTAPETATVAPLRVVHIASFSGNIGDNANHMGFRPWFETLSGRRVAWTNIEIREFYWRERQWDADLVDFINTHDLLVIGGGNYFELWVEDSPTGTSVAIDPALFDQIAVPVLFNALGVDPGQGVPSTCQKRFTRFLDQILASANCLVTVRNDGAKQNLRTHIGESYADRIPELPDHGFFVPAPAPSGQKDIGQGASLVAINLAGDMMDTRFSGFDEPDGFVREMASVITELGECHPHLQFCLVPHIFRDLEIISQTIECLNDRLRRTRLTVAPYVSGDDGARQILSIYQSADLVLGMRFHANVCPLALGRNVIGLNCYPQIENLYRGLSLTDHLAHVGHPGFSNQIIDLAQQAITAPDRYAAEAHRPLQRVRKARADLEPGLQNWLETALV